MRWVILTCKLRPADRTALERLAKAEDRSMSSLVRQALRQRLDAAAVKETKQNHGETVIP